MKEPVYYEYHFRIEMPSVGARDELRAIFLEIVRGFTEIEPEYLKDLISGHGHGYIVGVKNADQGRRLKQKIRAFVKSRNIPRPEIRLSWKNPVVVSFFCL